MFRKHTRHPINHPCKNCNNVVAETPQPINLGSVDVACVTPPMPTSVADTCCSCCATDITYTKCDGSGQTMTSSFGKQCPVGYVPHEVYIAKNDPMFEPLFGCYDYHEIAALLDRYLCYHLCGCGAARSVLLATAHFTQLHTIINPQTMRAWARQATKPTAVLSPFPDAMIKSKYGQQHWVLTTFGMEYQDLKMPARALAGLAWGA